MSRDSIWLQGVMESNGIAVDESQREMLERYVSLLLDWNSKINLISRKSEDTIWEEQILHSLSFLSRIEISHSASVIDIGTGGGLPGIPLKILIPGLSMTLVDSIKKKITAVQSIIESLGMHTIEAVWSRAEDLNRGMEKSGSKRVFDYVICRAVGELADLWKYGYPLLRPILSGSKQIEGNRTKPSSGKIAIPPGAVLALKGGDIEEELAAIGKTSKVSITVIDISLITFDVLTNNEKKIVIMRPN
jgi:16S rRNA (guanine527-N7)-methyltransferase